MALRMTLPVLSEEEEARHTSPAAACRDVAPELCVQRGFARPLPPGNAGTGAARTCGCSAAAPSVSALPGAGTGSGLPDPPHLKNNIGRRLTQGVLSLSRCSVFLCYPGIHLES